MTINALFSHVLPLILIENAGGPGLGAHSLDGKYHQMNRVSLNEWARNLDPIIRHR